ncbi:PIF1 helicase [Elysia marginata]|uniref:PIF1 helicase n=1 Tax=Elysia marginata TaxID=1093978 RepID=A0AAV4EAH8_9GAST|nr:PIF1 helicase [Elysia marginata]
MESERTQVAGRKREARLDKDEIRADTIGRTPTISPSPRQAELYYLRMLLHHKPGATSFTDLQTIDGINYDSFQECCHKLGLLDDDTEKDAAMMEATAIWFAPQLRLAFATILIYCRPADPLAFWERHKSELCRDFVMRDQSSDLNHYNENQALSHLQTILDNEGLDRNADFKLPHAEVFQSPGGPPKAVHDELHHNYVILEEHVHQGYPKLTQEQSMFLTLS